MSEVKVLLGFQSRESVIQVKETLQNLNNIKYFESFDGTDCLFKLGNSAPNILIIEEPLSRRTGSQVVDWILKKGSSLDQVALILISDKKPTGEFSDAMASGRLQILNTNFVLTRFKLAFVQAFNYVAGLSHQKFHVKMVAKEDVLIREGEKAEAVYLLQSGHLRAVHLDGEDEKLLGYIEPGEFVGEMAYINQDLRSATVIADEDSELVEIPIQFADQILFQKPSWTKALMRTLSRRLKRSYASRV
ncbi:MAG: hypothetical protein CL676_00305 [Bdellovibrionaceae bacterium]|nr:hypothetical protein [Pseudobdellovibrionaceae bacterium]|tara:strand:- start:450 stop:1190 length:741 start_codon:yes stop_codon:yes gene_type:complete